MKTFQVDFRDVPTDFSDVLGMYLQFWQWTLMIGQYDHLSHPYFSYYSESESESIQVTAQNIWFAYDGFWFGFLVI